MVLAARLRRIPAALTEADAHLGLANRLAAPFARRLFLAYDIPGRRGAKTRVVGRPIPKAHLDVSRAEGRARFGFAAEAPVVGVFGAYAGARSLNELAVEAWAATARTSSTSRGERDYDELRRRVDAAGLRAAREHAGTSAPRWPPPTSPSPGPAARSGSSPPPGRPPCSCRTPTRPPTTRR